MRRVRFDVETWACGAHEDEVRETLLSCHGVADATVDLAGERVAVDLEGSAVEEEALEDVLGFFGLQPRRAGTTPHEG